MRTTPIRLTTLLLIAASLPACGSSPGGSAAKDAVTSAINTSAHHTFDISVSLGQWNPDPQSSDGSRMIAQWTADVTMPEDYGYIEMQVDDKNVVNVSAKKGAAVKLAGTLLSEKTGSGEVYSLVGGDAWASFRQVLAVPPGYAVIRGDTTDIIMRRANDQDCPIEPISDFHNAVAGGSPEGKQLQAHAADIEKAVADHTAADRDKAAAAKVQQQSEKQTALMKPWLAVFAGPNGAIISRGAGNLVSTLITEAHIDDAAGKVTGKGIDFSQMPFRPFTFDAALTMQNRTGTFTFTSSLSSDPIVFTTLLPKPLLENTGGVTLAPIDALGRAALDQEATIGMPLGAAAEVKLTGDVLDASAAADRQKQIATTPLNGVTTHDGKKATALDGLFTSKPGGKKAFHWKDDTVALRLDMPQSGSALYIEGGASDSQGVVVTINGIHRLTLGTIPASAGAVVTPPPDLQILDIRLDAKGDFYTHGIMLVK